MDFEQTIAEQDAAIVRALGIPSYILGASSPDRESALVREDVRRLMRSYLLTMMRIAAAPREDDATP